MWLPPAFFARKSTWVTCHSDYPQHRCEASIICYVFQTTLGSNDRRRHIHSFMSCGPHFSSLHSYLFLPAVSIFNDSRAMGLILSGTETLVANALGLLGVILKRLSTCLHVHQHNRTRRGHGSNNLTLREQRRLMSGRLHPPHLTGSLADPAIVTPLAFHRAGSSKSLATRTRESGGALQLPDRHSVKENGSHHSFGLNHFYYTEVSALQPRAKAKLSTHDIAQPLKGIMQQNKAQNRKSTLAYGRVERAATNAPNSEILTPRSTYQRHIEELEKRRVILHSIKRDYGLVKADYEKSENTLQCLRRQDLHTPRSWRKQKRSAESSLGKL